MKVMVFDVGGTGIKYSVMDEQLNRTDTGSTPTPADSQEHFLNTLREIYLPHKDEVDGIALSLPGFIDAEQGVVKGGGAPSLAYNVGTPVGPRLAEVCGCRVWIENDGKAAAIAELERGVLKGCRNAAVFIIGTGVGGAEYICLKVICVFDFEFCVPLSYKTSLFTLKICPAFLIAHFLGISIQFLHIAALFG